MTRRPAPSEMHSDLLADLRQVVATPLAPSAADQPAVPPSSAVPTTTAVPEPPTVEARVSLQPWSWPRLRVGEDVVLTGGPLRLVLGLSRR